MYIHSVVKKEQVICIILFYSNCILPTLFCVSDPEIALDNYENTMHNAGLKKKGGRERKRKEMKAMKHKRALQHQQELVTAPCFFEHSPMLLVGQTQARACRHL